MTKRYFTHCRSEFNVQNYSMYSRPTIQQMYNSAALCSVHALNKSRYGWIMAKPLYCYCIMQISNCIPTLYNYLATI